MKPTHNPKSLTIRNPLISLKSGFTLLATALISAGSLCAQVPQLLNYQGRVATGGVNFDGPGSFKFVLEDTTGITTYWSNDGTSVGGGEPTSAVQLPVTKGLYSVLLGDATLPNMTPVPAAVFAQPDVRMRVWFNDGVHGSQRLAPDQRIASVGYAMMAKDVPLGSITNTRLAAGAVQPDKLAPGAAAANLHAGGEAGLTSGSLVLSATVNPSLAGAGYVRIGTTQLADAWTFGSNVGAVAARRNHTAVWTGTQMIVWGGYDGLFPNLGGRYNPVTNVWLPVEISDGPNGQEGHSAVWTGTQMIIWGGSNGVANTKVGGRYDPVSNSWSLVNSTGAPSARYTHTALWTGTEMIVWGGFGAGGVLGDGARYIPASDTWVPMSNVGAPSARNGHSAIWTGTEMIIWGGRAPGGVYFGNGARYAPSTNTWTAIPPNAGAPSARSNHTAVWTGSEMILWGGEDAVGYQGNGNRYNPANSTWSFVINGGGVRTRHTAVWTGSEMIVWGGENVVGQVNTGARYQPASDTWLPVTTAGAPLARSLHTTIWTGSELIVFGGSNGSFLGDTALYTPGRTMQLYQRP